MKKSDSSKIASVPEKLAGQGGLLTGVAKQVSEDTGVPAAEVYGVGSFFHLLSRSDAKVRVCQGLSCWMAGSEAVLSQALDLGLPAEGCSCLAACDQPVAVLRDRLVLPRVGSREIKQSGGDWKKLTSDFLNEEGVWFGHVDSFDDSGQKLVVHLHGNMDFSGEAYQRALELSSDDIIAELETSGLQGRGGAGFPAGRKWRSLCDQDKQTCYVVLNADEGEPGTFKDREIIMRRPDKVLEGLAIAALAVGAKEVYCYLRGEFELPIKILKNAIDEFERNDCFPGLTFHIHEGHGAYICGEETALLEALEGKLGLPRLKPPFPTEVGLWGKPTLIHNVETITCVSDIIRNGGNWFRDLGITGAGTKIYCISGHVNKPGVYEMPLGITLDELVEKAGGYVGELKAFSPGGASSGFLPASERSRPLDWKSLGEVGSSLGSAGVVVLNKNVSIRDATRETMVFFENESCGQCAPCRIGTRHQRESLDRYISSKEASDLNFVEDIAWEMEQGSICGLGHTASIPLLSARKWFPEAFE